MGSLLMEGGQEKRCSRALGTQPASPAESWKRGSKQGPAQRPKAGTGVTSQEATGGVTGVQ